MANNSELLILGCGHSESIDNFNNNAAIISSEGNLLIDCGHTIKHALFAQGMNIGDIDAVFITHVHGDHVFGLERVAYESKFKYGKKVKLFVHNRIIHELWDQTLKGSLGSNGDGVASLEDYFDVIVIKSDSFCFHENTIQLIEVNHTPGKATFGILINNKVFYSSDTVAIPHIIEHLKFDIGFHDVTLTPYNPVHASISSLVDNYPLHIRKKLNLMSYEDNWKEYEESVTREFNGFAWQGMRVPV